MKFFAPLALLVAVAAATGTTTSKAPVPTSTGSAQCCQNVQNSSQVSSVTKAIIFALLGINVSNLNIPIGTGCAPLSVLGGVSCNTNTVNCGSVLQGSLIGINCVPIIVNA